MNIIIDTHEQLLFTKCTNTLENNSKFNHIKISSQPLPLGDIIINDGTNDCIIIERKTLSDLISSIKDGRYEEQSYRLNGLNHHNHNIIYLIEGNLDNYHDTNNKQTLYSAMTSIHYFKGFSVMRSNHLDETATIICNMAYKIENALSTGRLGFYPTFNPSSDPSSEPNPNPNPSLSIDTANIDKTYCSVIKKIKKDNITPDNIGEIMLSQIPNVSSTSALAILSQFKTLPNLIKTIQEDETCLNNIYTTDINGKQRKISKNAIANIIKFLRV